GLRLPRCRSQCVSGASWTPHRQALYSCAYLLDAPLIRSNGIVPAKLFDPPSPSQGRAVTPDPSNAAGVGLQCAFAGDKSRAMIARAVSDAKPSPSAEALRTAEALRADGIDF